MDTLTCTKLQFLSEKFGLGKKFALIYAKANTLIVNIHELLDWSNIQRNIFLWKSLQKS